MFELFQALQLLWTRASESTLIQLLVSLTILVLAALGTRLASSHYREKHTGTAEERRSASAAARNTLAGLALVLLMLIWGGRLQHFALSLAALGAAIAIAGKEFFMCALGSLLRVLEGQYKIGDVIEINGHRGEVIEIDLLTTHLLEQGPSGYGTGRAIDFPNGMLLLFPVRTLATISGRFAHEFVRVPFAPAGDVVGARQRLLEAAERVCAEWIDEAESHFRRMEDAYLIKLPTTHPVALFEPVDANRVDVVVRFPCPSDRRLEASQHVLELYYAKQAQSFPTEPVGEQPPLGAVVSTDGQADPTAA